MIRQNAKDRLVSLSFNPVPDGAVVRLVRTHDGVTLRVALWQPDTPCRGTFYVLQGRTEFIERYAETIGLLLARGFAVVAFDWRGQGGSERLLEHPRRGHVAKFDNYCLDLEAVMAATADMCEARPFFVLAHSMGGTVLLRALHQKRVDVAACVLSAPMIGLSMVRYPRLVHGVARLLTGLGFGTKRVPGGTDEPLFPYEDNPLTRDRARFMIARQVFSVAPDLAIASPTIGWVKTSFDAMVALQNAAIGSTITTPILAVASPGDRITSTPITQAFLSHLPHATFLAIDHAEHEILLETDAIRAQFWAVFDQFIDAVLSASAAPSLLHAHGDHPPQ